MNILCGCVEIQMHIYKDVSPICLPIILPSSLVSACRPFRSSTFTSLSLPSTSLVCCIMRPDSVRDCRAFLMRSRDSVS